MSKIFGGGDVCKYCSTPFVQGALFCHICGNQRCATKNCNSIGCFMQEVPQLQPGSGSSSEFGQWQYMATLGPETPREPTLPRVPSPEVSVSEVVIIAQGQQSALPLEMSTPTTIESMHSKLPFSEASEQSFQSSFPVASSTELPAGESQQSVLTGDFSL